MLRRTTVAALVIGMLAVGALVCAADKDDVKAAAMSFAKGLQGGDGAAVKAACTGSEKQLAVIDAMVDLIKSMKTLGDSATKKFGDAGKAIVKDQGNPGDELVKQLEQADIKVEGDVATITSKDSKEDPVKMKKVDGKWKIDLNAMPNQDEMAKASGVFKAMSKAATETATDITAGKFKTADEAKQAVDMKMMAAIMAAAAPTSQPAK